MLLFIYFRLPLFILGVVGTVAAFNIGDGLERGILVASLALPLLDWIPSVILSLGRSQSWNLQRKTYFSLSALFATTLLLQVGLSVTAFILVRSRNQDSWAKLAGNPYYLDMNIITILMVTYSTLLASIHISWLLLRRALPTTLRYPMTYEVTYGEYHPYDDTRAPGSLLQLRLKQQRERAEQAHRDILAANSDADPRRAVSDGNSIASYRPSDTASLDADLVFWTDKWKGFSLEEAWKTSLCLLSCDVLLTLILVPTIR